MNIPHKDISGRMLPSIDVNPDKFNGLFDIAIGCISEITGVCAEDIVGTRRTDRICFSRFMLYKMSRDEFSSHYPPTYEWIASKMEGTGLKSSSGGKHHGSVISGIETLCNRISTNAKEFSIYSRVLGLFEESRARFLDMKIPDGQLSTEGAVLRIAASRCASAIRENELELESLMGRISALEEAASDSEDAIKGRMMCLFRNVSLRREVDSEGMVQK